MLTPSGSLMWTHRTELPTKGSIGSCIVVLYSQPWWQREYGPQDFIGQVDEMRLWKVVRTPEQIKRVSEANDVLRAC